MQVHIYDCLSRDERIIKETESVKEVEYLSAYDSDDGKRKPKTYSDRKTHHMVIHLFGMDEKGQAMRIDVNGFRPFFYVALPNELIDYSPIEKHLRTKLRADVDLIKFEIENHQKFYSYTGGKSFRFLKMSFQSLSMFYTVRKEFLDEKQVPKMSIKGGKPLEVYESNIDPMLRFFHMRGISPCGWVWVKRDEVESETGMRMQCDWKEIGPATGGVALATSEPRTQAPLLHAFWDIECYSHSGEFPQAAPAKKPCLEAKLCGKTKCSACQANGGDPIIQIGTTLWSHNILERHIFVLDTCDPVPGATLHVCKTEKELLIGWCQMMVDRNVNVFIGYNIFGFDEKYLWERLTKFGLEQDDAVQGLSLLAQEGKEMKLDEKRLSSSALGDNFLFMWTTPGRLRIDLLGHIKRKAQLPSYKLDSVAAVYLSGKLSSFEQVEGRRWLIKVSKKEKGDARVGRAVQLLDDLGEQLTEKLIIKEIVSEGFIVEVGEVDEDLRAVAGGAVRWAVTKDDVSPQDIFRLHRGSSADRAVVAAYCVQDCDLTLELYKKLDVFNEAMAMANVCWVPVSYIFTRGQGIKIESLIFEYCMHSRQLIKVLESQMGKPDAPSKEIENQYNEMNSSKLKECIDEYKTTHEYARATEPYISYSMAREPGFEDYADDPKNRRLDKKHEYLKKLFMYKEQIENSKQDSYEGAIVLTPTPGFYTDPVGVCDFSSLYPSTIISENISHDSLVWAKDYDMEGKLVCVSYGSTDDERWAPTGTQWTDIEFDILRPDPEDTRKHPVKRKVGVRHCRYAQPAEGKGSLPKIVAKLLAARKATRAQIPKTDDPFKKALLDAEQNAYKVTANSLYGQLGSPTFKIRLQNLAASVTAYGRKQIMFSKEAIEQFYGPAAADPRCSAEIVYGDTDSIFVGFNPKNPVTGEALVGREAREATKALTEEVGAFITGALKAPHDFEYDKIFSPFIIFSKKRYVGNKYEDSVDNFKETSMGIVLKRRDNAPLLKMTYGAAIDRLLNHQDVPGAVAAVKAKVRDLVEGRMKLSQLTITKSLRSEYKCTPPAHKILANRIAERDPGNAPASGERIGYVYVQALAGQVPSKLQGDRVETPDWIQKHGLKPDFEYYIDHQLYNPIAQLFSIMVEKMPGFVAPVWATDPDKLIGQKEALAGRLLFEEGISACHREAKRSFVSKMFSGTCASTPTSAPSPRVFRAAPVDNTMAAAEAAAFGAGGGAKRLKQQSIMSAFAIDTALMSDERLARDMRAVKAAKRKTNSKADVPT
jgi:DNA polymerase elongation subunit (family B)